MTKSRVLSEQGWGWQESVIMGAVIIGMLIPWTLFVLAPPDGTVPLIGIVVSIAAGGYLAFVVYSYLRY